MIYGKIFPTTRHSFHVRWNVRKATLNGPKVFGYFWAPKVTMKSVTLKWAEALRIRIIFGIRELLRRFWLLLGSKSNEESVLY